MPNYQVCFHNPVIVPYVLAALAIYGLDHLVRLVKLRICIARIRPFPELEMTQVQVYNLNSGWRAGQHVRLRVLCSSMGWWGWTENHPFTIASVSSTEDGLVLMCKQSGAWTTKLYDMAKASGYGDSGKGVGRDVRVMIEGPYGIRHFFVPMNTWLNFVIRWPRIHRLCKLFCSNIYLWWQWYYVWSLWSARTREAGFRRN